MVWREQTNTFDNTGLLQQPFKIHANNIIDKENSDRQRKLAAGIDYISRTSPCRTLDCHHHTHSSHEYSKSSTDDSHRHTQDIRTWYAHIKMTRFTICSLEEKDYDITGDEKV